MGIQRHEAQRHPAIHGDDVLGEQDVAQGFGHFFVVDVDESVVEPIAREMVAIMGFRLGDLVLMMGEFQIESAAMDIDEAVLVGKQGVDHDAAFRVPARTALRPRGVPTDAFFGLFPKGEIQGGFLLRIHFDARAGNERFRGIAGKAPVIGDMGDAEINVPVRDIGAPVFDEIVDVGNHLGHVNRGTGRLIRGQRAHLGNDVLEFLDDGIGQFLLGNPELFGSLDDLVVHIRVIGNERDVVANGRKQAAPGIENDDGAEIPDVGRIIDRRTADVERDLAGYDGDEFLQGIPEGRIQNDLTHTLILFHPRILNRGKMQQIAKIRKRARHGSQKGLVVMPIPIKAKEAREAGGFRGQGIHGGIPDENGVLGTKAKIAENPFDLNRIRLDGVAVFVAKDAGKKGIRQAAPHDILSHRVRLVRNDEQRVAPGLQSLQNLHDAGEGGRMDSLVRHVPGQKSLFQGAEARFLVEWAESSMHERFGPGANQALGFFVGIGNRDPDFLQGIVQGILDVVEGIEQRPVQIK